MKTLRPAEQKLLEQFFQLKQENLLKIMSKYLKGKYDKVYTTNEYIVAVGDIPVALVAHLDTVFAAPPQDIYYDRLKNVMWSPDGLGADDRAGVYAITQIIKRGLRPTIILTTDEEKGTLGAAALVKENPTPMVDELKYIIQLDRRGSVDCVFYDCDNPEFEEYVESFGFLTAFGTFSDISTICPVWKVAGVNLSIGYVNEHSYAEVLHINHMMATIDKVEKMLKDIDNAKWFEYIEKEYKFIFNANKDNDWGWDPSYGVPQQVWHDWHTSGDKIISCECCGENEFEYNLFPVKGLDKETIYLCADCVNASPVVGWCLRCGEAFIAKSDNEIDKHFCYDCYAEEGIDVKND